MKITDNIRRCAIILNNQSHSQKSTVAAIYGDEKTIL